MIHFNFYFESYDWEIEVYIILKNCYINTIINSLQNCSQNEIQKAFLNLTTKVDSGFINSFNRKSID